MKRVAVFEKVSFEQFRKDYLRFNRKLSEDEIKEAYDGIKLPKRGTTGSMGNDFFAPYDVNIPCWKSVVIPTGIKVKFLEEGWGLVIAPRSGSSFNYGISLANTIGVIDSDYYHSNNEGHILMKISNESIVNNNEDTAYFNAGIGFCQGIFLPYGITFDDDVETKRDGGFGSTG